MNHRGNSSGRLGFIVSGLIVLASVTSCGRTLFSMGEPAAVNPVVAYLMAPTPPGAYTAIERSAALAGGQDPDHMADLIGAFVFGMKLGDPAAPTVNPPRTGSAANGDIQSVNFRDFSYPSNCWEKMDDAFDRIIHVSNGEWTRQRSDGIIIGFSVAKVVFGDLKGDGAAEAVVATSCQGMANFDYEELFVYEMAGAAPKLLAKLTPPDWGGGQDCSGPNCPILELSITKRRLAVGFGVGGSHAQPDWVVTARFEWNGSALVRVRMSRKPFTGGR